MARRVKNRSPKAGLPPGTLVHIGEKTMQDAAVSVIDYNEAGCRELSPSSAQECGILRESDTVTWINVDGIHDVHLVEQLGQVFGVHPLAQEDIVNSAQRPKFEDFGDHLFLCLKMLYLDEDRGRIVAEQVSLVIGAGFVLSFQEAPGDVFDGIRKRIRDGKGRVRKMGADYLAYVLMDAIVDNYFSILERFGENIEVLEDEIIGQPTPELLREIHGLRREVSFLRRCSWPLREMIGNAARAENALVQERTAMYFRDLYDHSLQVVDAVEMFRESLSGLLEIHLSSSSNRMNEVMKTLTIIATIFIPLTFIAGVYGMNVEMPEAKYPWAYPVILGVMAAVGVVMLGYFRRKRWL
jgi:magnesium transporter